MKFFLIKFSLFIFLIMPLLAHAQEVKRPEVWGIAKMTFLVSDLQVANDYYGKFLGFEKAFFYSSDLGNIVSYKVNDRQFLEFIVDKQAKEKKRLVSYSLETENVEQMRLFLKSKNVKVPEKTITDGAGNEIFVVDDPSGNHIEFITYNQEGLHRTSKGMFLSGKRISKRIHHAGIYAKTMADDDPFYVGILGFKEQVRYPDERSQPPAILYLGFGDGTENIEHYSPNDENVSHPCFLVDDMQETIYTLKERRVNEKIGKPMIGKGKRWIMNMRNLDNTRVEFTEAFCVR